MVEDFFFAVAASIMAAQALLPKTMGICHIWRYHDGRTLTGMGAGLSWIIGCLVYFNR